MAGTTTTPTSTTTTIPASYLVGGTNTPNDGRTVPAVVLMDPTTGLPLVAQPVTVAALPLPTGAAQDLTLTDGQQKAQITTLPADGATFATLSAAYITPTVGGPPDSAPPASTLVLPLGNGQSSWDASIGGTIAPSLVAPTAAPAPALSYGTGNTVAAGVYGVQVSYINSTGETLPSPALALTVPPPTPAPATAPTVAAPTPGGLVDAGAHVYAVTLVNPAGETTAGTVSTAVTAYASIAAPTTAPTVGAAMPGGAVDAGAHVYAATFTNPAGETTLSTVSATVTTFAPLTTPAPAPTVATATTGGAGLAPATAYTYAITVENSIGETTVGPASTSVTTGAGATNSVTLSAIPTAPVGSSARRIYRATAGGLYGLIAIIADDTTTSYTDTGAVPQGNTPPTVNTTNAQTVPLAALPTGPAGTTARKLYRSKAGTTTPLYLVATLADNTTVTYTDTMADAALGVVSPVANTTEAQTVPLTAIPTGAAGTTARKVYRSKAGTTTPLYLVATLTDNTTAVYTDATADAALGVVSPVANTTEAQTVALTAIPSGPAGTTGRKLYRSKVGTTTPLYLVATLADNTTVTYTDTTADASLGGASPSVNSSGANTLTLPSPPPSSNATGWYAYVTQPGGVTYTGQQAAGSPTAIGSPLTLTAPPTTTGAAPLTVATTVVTSVAFDGTLDPNPATTAWFAVPAIPLGMASASPTFTLTPAPHATATVHGGAGGYAQVRIRVVTYNGTDQVAVTLRASAASPIVRTVAVATTPPDLAATAALAASQASPTSPTAAIPSSALALPLGSGQASWDAYVGGAIAPPMVAPVAAPAPAVTYVVGGTVAPGVYGLEVSYINTTGETTPSPATSITVPAPVPAPTTAPTVGAATANGAVDAGTHVYAATLVNAIGETTAGTVSTAATAYASIPAPTTAPTVGAAMPGGAVDAGAHVYAATLVNAAGETPSGTVSAAVTTIAALAATVPPVPTTATTGGTVGAALAAPAAPAPTTATTGGTVAAGTYPVAVTYVNPAGETVGSANGSVTTTGTTSTITVPAPAASGNATAYYAYVGAAGGAAGSGTRQQVAGSPTALGTAYTLTAPPTTTGAAIPTTTTAYLPYAIEVTYVNAAGETVASASASITPTTTTSTITVPAPAASGNATGYYAYVTQANGTTYTRQQAAGSPTALGTAFTLTAPPTTTGAAPPTVNTTNTQTVALTAIPTGPAATTARKVYRSKAGTTTPLYLVATLTDNTTAVYTDTMADAALGAASPAANTTEAQTVALSAIPTGAAGTTARKVYRSKAGTTTPLYLLATLANNTTTVYTDATADAALGVVSPALNSSGANTLTLPSPPPSSNATGYYVYTTQPGGVTYTRQQAAGSPTAIGTAYVLGTPPITTGAGPLAAATSVATSVAFDATLDPNPLTTAWFPVNPTQLGGPQDGPVAALTLAGAPVAVHGGAAGYAQVRVRVQSYNGTDSLATMLRASAASPSVIKATISPLTSVDVVTIGKVYTPIYTESAPSARLATGGTTVYQQVFVPIAFPAGFNPTELGLSGVLGPLTFATNGTPAGQVQLNLEHQDAGGRWTQIWNSGPITANAGVASYPSTSVGAGLTNNVCFTNTLRWNYVFTGTFTAASLTEQVSLWGK